MPKQDVEQLSQTVTTLQESVASHDQEFVGIRVMKQKLASSGSTPADNTDLFELTKKMNIMQERLEKFEVGILGEGKEEKPQEKNRRRLSISSALKQKQEDQQYEVSNMMDGKIDLVSVVS